MIPLNSAIIDAIFLDPLIRDFSASLNNHQRKDYSIILCRSYLNVICDSDDIDFHSQIHTYEQAYRLILFLYCPKNIQNLCIKTKPVTVGVILVFGPHTYCKCKKPDKLLRCICPSRECVGFLAVIQIISTLLERKRIVARIQSYSTK